MKVAEILIQLLYCGVAEIWRLLTLPPNLQDRKRMIVSIAFGMLIIAGFVCCVAILVDYHTRVKPAVEAAVQASDKQGFDSPGVFFLLPEIIHTGYFVMACWATTICTLLTWRYHGVWIRLVGLSSFLLLGVGRLVGM